jgi:hypothetical protein
LQVARKGGVAVLGSVVLALGIALIVFPGPAILVIPFGLAIMATEFLWARKLLLPLRTLLQGVRARARRILGKPPKPAGDHEPPSGTQMSFTTNR